MAEARQVHGELARILSKLENKIDELTSNGEMDIYDVGIFSDKLFELGKKYDVSYKQAEQRIRTKKNLKSLKKYIEKGFLK
jgi:hypothetical protein